MIYHWLVNIISMEKHEPMMPMAWNGDLPFLASNNTGGTTTTITTTTLPPTDDR